MFNQCSFETVSIKMNQKEFVILITVAILSPVLILLGVIFCCYKNKEKITEGEVNQDEPKTTPIFEKKTPRLGQNGHKRKLTKI